MNRAAMLWRVASILVAASFIAAWQLIANLRVAADSASKERENG